MMIGYNERMSNVIYPFGNPDAVGEHEQGVTSSENRQAIELFKDRLESQVLDRLKKAGGFMPTPTEELVDMVLGNAEHELLANNAWSEVSFDRWEDLLVSDILRHCYLRVDGCEMLTKGDVTRIAQSAAAHSMAAFEAAEREGVDYIHEMTRKTVSSVEYLYDKVTAEREL